MKQTTQDFTIYKQINKELDEFFNKKIYLSGNFVDDVSIKYLGRKTSGYAYNQYELIQLIDLYWNSQFSTGSLDPQGREKLFLNVGKFRTEVASKQIDLDTKDFTFIPEDHSSAIGAWLMQQEFKEYVKTTYFGELVNEVVEAFPKYGTVVLKKVGKRLEFVPLQTLRNDQTAKTLDDATFIIEEHTDMSMGDIKAMEKNGWNLKDFSVPYGETCTVYERTGTIPKWYLNKVNNKPYNKDDEDEVVDAFFIVTIDKTPRSKKNIDNGHIFYAKEISERPYREVHWSKQHGRWMGIGEMENQIPNQIAKNVIVNILKNSFEWSSKRLFTTLQENMAGNLAKETKDGDVLVLEPNGDLQQVDLSTRFSAEANNLMNEWERNSDQKSFTFEIATGEQMKSGTPFRLGVMLSNAANSHFAFKREKLAFIFKKSIMDFLIPEFIRKAKAGENVVIMNGDLPGFEVIRKAAENHIVGQAIKASVLSGQLISPDIIKQFTDPIKIAHELFIKRPAGFYDKIKTKFNIVITGEQTDVEKRIISLTTLYQMLAAQGDPRAEKVLERVLALSGENISLYGGTEPPLIPGLSSTTGRPGNLESPPGIEQRKSSLAIPDTTQNLGSK
jgi:hypothetical protein